MDCEFDEICVATWMQIAVMWVHEHAGLHAIVLFCMQARMLSRTEDDPLLLPLW